ncbi:MAG: hypothetical protein JO311_04140 [Candidatus Eremiobacteraeota bacterium]|nr:hypothetical protein [Candidatus Eremiobacteraeota bacterium]MBV9262895.1 hypothetical protein [Candidatus Eremiobacteraeota bacterium]
MDSVAATRVAQMFEAVMLAPVLRPMIAGAGLLGDYELDTLARDIAERDGSFARLIAAGLAQR